MLREERQELLLRELRLRGIVRCADFAARHGLAEVTVRRDIRQLAEEGHARKIHGGAALPEAPAPDAGHPQGPSAVLGMVVPASAYYFAAVVQGAQEAARRRGARLILGVSHYDTAREQEQIERLLGLRVDALLVTPARPQPQDASTYQLLERANVPVVLVERTIEEGPGNRLESVRTDHAHGAGQAVQLLAQLDHTSVALALDPRTATAPWLLSGSRAAMAQLCLGEAGAPAELPQSSDDIAALTAALGELLDRCRATGTRAVLVHPDTAAVALTELAARRGVRIPHDLSVVAYDDEVAGLAEPQLTAVAPPKFDVGRAAVELAFLRLSDAGRPDSAAPRRIALLPQLHVRRSTAHPNEAP